MPRITRNAVRGAIGRRCLVILIALRAVPACSGARDESSVTVAWTLAGASDANTCVAWHASSVHVSVWREGDFEVMSDAHVPCTTLRHRFSAPPGRYSASLTLVAAPYASMSDTHVMAPFDVAPAEPLIVSMDFPKPLDAP